MNVFELFSRAGLTVDPAVIEALGWTLLHFLWQGALVAAVLALADVLLVRRRPQFRYAAACAALLVMLVLPVTTFVGKHERAARTSSESAREIAHRKTPLPASRSRALDGLLGPSRKLLPATLISTRVEPARPRNSARLWLARLPERFSSSRLLPWLVALWGAGVMLLSLRLLGGWWLVARLARSSKNVPIEAWQVTLTSLARRMGVTRTVRLVRSGLVSVPSAIGWLRPVILLPASTLTGLSPAQIEAILAHELAHIRRHDYLVNLLQSVIETLLFYHPAVWWVSRRIREERELCCDDLAVRASGDAVTYARALCQLEQLRGESARMALAASGGSLVARIARLLGASSQRPHLEASRGLAWALVASVVLIGVAGGAVRVNPQAPLAKAARLVTFTPLTPFTPFTPLTPATPRTPSVPRAPRPALAVAAPLEEPDPVEETQPAPEASAELAQGFADLAEGFADLVKGFAEMEGADAARAPIACEEQAKADKACQAQKADDDQEHQEHMEDQEALGQASSRHGSDRFTAEEWERLSQAGVSPRYVANLERAGYGDLSVEELSRLAQHGVSSAYARAIRRTIDDPSVEDLVRLATHGVSSQYASSMRRKLGKLDVQDLVRLANAGVSSEYVAGIRELDLGDLSAEDLIRLANSGVTLEWFSSLRWMGYSDISVEEAIQLRNSGVTSDYAASLRSLNRNNLLSLDELRTLQNQGIEVQYVAALLGLLRKDLSVNQIIRLRQQGVTVQYVGSLKALGYGDITSDELIALHQQGVDPAFIAAMAGAISERVPPRDLIRLVQGGVDADFISQARDAGFDTRDVDELIRMRQRGIPNRTNIP